MMTMFNMKLMMMMMMIQPWFHLFQITDQSLGDGGRPVYLRVIGSVIPRLTDCEQTALPHRAQDHNLSPSTMGKFRVDQLVFISLL